MQCTFVCNIHLSVILNVFSQFLETPVNYDDMHQKLSCEGGRVLALGYKTMKDLSTKEVRLPNILIVTSVCSVYCLMQNTMFYIFLWP